MIVRILALLFVSSTSVFAATNSINLNNFSDAGQVPAWAQSSFSGLLETGIIEGNNKNELKPLDTINRAEFTKILLEATKKTLINPEQNTFKDVLPAQWFYSYVETAADLGWVTGYNNGDFKPGNQINRAEIAKLINKAFNLQPVVLPTDKTWYDAEVLTLSNNNILPYNVSKSAFDAAINPTRSEAFDQIYRAMNLQTVSAITETPPEAPVQKSTEEIFDAPTTFTPLAVQESAGNLNVSGIKNAKSTLSQGQQTASLGTFIFNAESGASKINGLQIRRIGNGNISNYTSLWLEANGQKITAEITPSDDLITFNLNNLVTLNSGQTWRAELKGNVSQTAKLGSSERFVLYLPSWVNATTTKVIGLFPIAGNNISIQ